jgi:RES domain-containing protein
MPDRPELPEPATLDGLEDAQIDLGEVTAYRVLALRPGQDRATATDFVKENTLGARWNPPGVAAIYSSLERETAGAEGAHLMSVNNPTGRFQLGELSLHLVRVVDLRTEERLASVRVTREDVESSDHTACRLIGSACAWLGMSGLLVPSARRWPETNLVIYPGNLEGPEFIEPAGTPEDWTTA